jgi:hypothetical protein
MSGQEPGLWWSAGQAYLARLGAAEYTAAMRAHKKRGRSVKTYRHTPSQYHMDLARLLGEDDEHGFKARKMLEGYASILGV